jgi:hypothetical protein
MQKFLINPYRPFFFIGFFAALLGVGVWIAFAFVPGLFYPGRFHAHLMMGVFLMCYALGFLMTALPRLTQTPYANNFEFMWAMLSMVWILTVGMCESSEKMFFIGTLSSSIFLFYFGIKRLIITKSPVPNFFPLIFWGIFSTFVASLLVLADQVLLGFALFYQNFMICLVLGIGSFLIPRILGNSTSPKIASKKIYFLIGLLMTLSLILNELYFYDWASYLRAALATGLVVFGWKISFKMKLNNSVALGIVVSTLSTLLGLWAMAIFPQYKLEAQHAIYITGFSLLTFMVASRVILSHGNYGLEGEKKNAFVLLAIFFILLAAVTRISAIFISHSYEKH